jgi:homoserine trans-succinylase
LGFFAFDLQSVFAVTFFDAKESNQRPQFLPILSLMPKKVFKERHPGSLDSACAEPL